MHNMIVQDDKDFLSFQEKLFENKISLKNDLFIVYEKSDEVKAVCSLNNEKLYDIVASDVIPSCENIATTLEPVINSQKYNESVSTKRDN